MNSRIVLQAWCMAMASGLVAAYPAYSQISPLTCQLSAGPVQARIEGQAELTGDITIDCRGGQAGSQIRPNITISLNKTIANRISNNIARGAVLAVDQGSGFAVSNVPATVVSGTTISFNGVDATIPASQRVVLQVRGLRADVAGTDGTVVAFVNVSAAANLTLNTNTAVVAQAQAGLFAVSGTTQIACRLSRFPDAMTMAAAREEGTAEFGARFTEGFATAFGPKEAGADQGTRLMVRYSGFPQGARLAVPDVIAGSSAPTPTSAGEFGWQASNGQYAAGSLLLVRILGTDANGAGGFPAVSLNETLPFGSLREVGLTNGAGVAVYEVLDANAFLRESAQVPTYLDLRTQASTVAEMRQSFAPLGGTTIPRFADVVPGNDCAALNDCSAGYFPTFVVDTQALSATAPLQSPFQVQYIRVRNEGGGSVLWNVRVDYGSGSGWLRVDRTSGADNGTIRVDFLPDRVTAAGTYEATLTIDAGPLVGTRVIAVKFTVGAASNTPVVQSVAHAASFQEEVVPGGLAMLKGQKLAGREVGVRVGGAAARIQYHSAEQINFEVPASAAGRDSAELVVTVDGVSSETRNVKLRSVLPGIFAGGVFQASGTAVSASSPAKIGEAIRVLTTGIPASSLGTVTVRIHDWNGLQPVRAASIPEVPGVQYVDVRIPVGMPGITSELAVCAGGVCSTPVRIAMVE